MYANGFNDGFDGYPKVSMVLEFQKFHALPETGIANLTTWLSISVSYGDQSRPCKACDTRFEITKERLEILKQKGYNYVGRYLTGGDFKEIREGELERIFDAGLSVFPIFQAKGTASTDFTVEKAIENAKTAQNAAINKGVPKGSVIYFAVDYDAQDGDITNYIIPYFEKINATMSYKIGVYGTRNLCTRVCNAGFAISSFVSDMSSEFSGNLGFTLPRNWAFDQILEEKNIDGKGFDLDKVAFSGIAHILDSKILWINDRYFIYQPFLCGIYVYDIKLETHTEIYQAIKKDGMIDIVSVDNGKVRLDIEYYDEDKTDEKVVIEYRFGNNDEINFATGGE